MSDEPDYTSLGDEDLVQIVKTANKRAYRRYDRGPLFYEKWRASLRDFFNAMPGVNFSVISRKTHINPVTVAKILMGRAVVRDDTMIDFFAGVAAAWPESVDKLKTIQGEYTSNRVTYIDPLKDLRPILKEEDAQTEATRQALRRIAVRLGTITTQAENVNRAYREAILQMHDIRRQLVAAAGYPETEEDSE